MTSFVRAGTPTLGWLLPKKTMGLELLEDMVLSPESIVATS
jgi:hypothetical protein